MTKERYYHPINDEEQLQGFLELIDYFHDSCIKEMHYISGGFVGDDLCVHPFDDIRTLSVIFQRQYKPNSVIELVFEDLVSLNLIPRKKDYDCIILDSILEKVNGFYIWDEWGDTQSIPVDDPGIRIVAKKLKWRALNNGLNEDIIFQNTKEPV